MGNEYVDFEESEYLLTKEAAQSFLASAAIEDNVEFYKYAIAVVKKSKGGEELHSELSMIEANDSLLPIHMNKYKRLQAEMTKQTNDKGHDEKHVVPM